LTFRGHRAIDGLAGMQRGAIVGGRFTVDRLAGTGGMGSVYLARDRGTGELVALKVLSSSGRQDLERFAREGRLLAELKHPGIVRYVAHGATVAGEPYLAMEWLEGEDLEARLARRGLTVAESVALGLRVAEALGAAHARGVVHRDVKPSNLFLPDSDIERVKLLDFGIARLTEGSDGITRTGMPIGTPAYMAPEQARGGPHVDARADVFSLGCVLFKCMTGRSAFVGEHAVAVLAKILLEEAPRVRELCPGAPEALDALVARMLSKDPAPRPANGSEVAAELASLGSIAPGPAALADAPPPSLGEGEQRLVSILMVGAPPGGAPDAARTMKLDETVPLLLADMPTRVAEAAAPADAADAALAACAARFDGQLVPLLGGARIVVLAGTAAATDLAARAAQCALAIQERLPDRATALATGRAEVRGALPVGAVIDRAARLLSAAPGSDVEGAARPVLIDEVTAGLLDSRFELGDGGAGLFVRRARAALEPTRTLLGKPTPYVGREQQLTALLGTFQVVVEEPVARAVLVTAPAGAGKSRLRHELVRKVRERGERVEIWVGQGDPMRAGSPFGMIAPLLRRVVGALDGEPLEVRRQKIRAHVARRVPERDVARVAEFLGELLGAPFDDAESVKLRAARKDAMVMGDQIRCAFEDLLAAECAAQPVMIVLEDLHWGDRPSANLLDGALRSLAEQPLMVLALARPEVNEVLPGLWAERGLEEIRLGGLTRKACERLIRSALGDPVPADTIARIIERADGNAFYLEELIRAVAEGKGDALPETVLAMVHARLTRLSSEARRVLRAASVFGEAFWQGGVMALLGGEGRTSGLDEWLRALAERELISRRVDSKFPGEREYAFRHALVREAAYATLTDEDRTLGHRLAGSWLAGAGESDAMALAEHFERGQAPGRAVRWYRRAAEQALEGNDLAAAIARAERGIQSIDAARRATEPTQPSAGIAPPDGGPQGDGPEGEVIGALRLIQSEAHKWRGENADAERRGLEAMRLLPRAGALWYRAAGEVAVTSGRLSHIQELCALLSELEAIAAARVMGPGHMIAAGRAVVSLILLGSTPRAAAMLGRLEEAGRRMDLTPDPSALAWLLRARAIHALHTGDVGAYLELTTASTAEFERAGDVRSACGMRVNIGFANTQLGRFGVAEQVLRETLATAERQGIKAISTGARNNLGMVLAYLGRLDEARAIEEEAAREFAAHGDRRLEGGSRTYLATIRMMAADLEGAEREARRAVEVLAGLAFSRAQALATLARVLVAQRHVDEALSATAEALSLIEDAGGTSEDETLIHLARAEALDAAGFRDDACAAIRIARDRLLARAEKISSAELRRSFLDEVPDHRRALSLAGAWLGDA
jgi:tetratricopeptide (TPR) repeat protein